MIRITIIIIIIITNDLLRKCCLDLSGEEYYGNLLKLNTSAILQSLYFSVLCLPPHEQVINEMNVPTIEQRTPYPSKCVVSACGPSHEH